VGNGQVTAYYSGSPEYTGSVNLVRMRADGVVEVSRSPLNGHPK